MAKVRRERSYKIPFGGQTQTVAEFDAIHARWAAQAHARLPDGVSQDSEVEKAVWPQTWGPIINGQARHGDGRDGDSYCLQCGGCAYYVELNSRLGMDWGACTNPRSQYDRQCVFEHWTCKAFSKG